MVKTLILSSELKEQLFRESKKYKLVETGGLLFGKNIDDEIIVVFSPILNDSKRGITHFYMDEDNAYRITNLLIDSGFDYLGNWHKHFGLPVPSHNDDKEVKNFFIRNPHRQMYLSLITSSKLEHNYELDATIYVNHENNIQKLNTPITIMNNTQIENKLDKIKFNIHNIIILLLEIIEKKYVLKFERIEIEETNEKSYEITMNYGPHVVLIYIRFIGDSLMLKDDIYIGISSQSRTTDISLIKYKLIDLLLNQEKFLSEIDDLFNKMKIILNQPISTYLSQMTNTVGESLSENTSFTEPIKEESFEAIPTKLMKDFKKYLNENIPATKHF